MTTIAFRDMVVDVEGQGPAVVMLHGLGGTSNSFQTLMPRLGGYRVVRPDLPGAGRSPVPRGKISADGLATSLLAVLGNLGIERAHIVGHSFGTLVAQHLAARSPSLAASLTLFGPIIAPAEAARGRLRDRATLARESGMDVVADGLLGGSLSSATHRDNPLAAAFVRESHMRQDAEGFAKSCEALADAEGADLAMIACPALVVTGEDDGVGPPSVAEDLAGRIPGSRCVALQRCGHWTPIEKPEECGTLLAEFLHSIMI